MPTKRRFDTDALRGLVGERVFARGQAYHRDGQVEILTVEPARVLARVAGTDEYRTEVTGRGDKIGGECSCPAFGDWGVCKHMVAVALAANVLGDGAQGADAYSLIREHLKQKSADDLIAMILDLAERDGALFRKLDMAAATLHADDKTLAVRLRRNIDQATRTDDYVHYREMPGWASDVDAALDAVVGLVAAGRGAPALELMEHAMGRIERAIEMVDDSDGYCGELLHRCREIHLAAARGVRPEPLGLARNLFDRELEDHYDVFCGASEVYAEVLGDAGLAEYRRLAAEAWAKLPLRSGPALERASPVGDYAKLAAILDVFAERDRDVDARIALRAKDLSSPWRYLQLAEFCLSQGREEEALRRAEEGLWLLEDSRPDERLASLAAELLMKAGRSGDAEALLQRVFAMEPSLDLYVRIRRFGASSSDRAIQVLRERLAKDTPRQWRRPTDLLVRVLMHDHAFGDAWAAVRSHGASMGAREALARASDAAHPREALGVYTERVESLVEGAGAAAYAEAAALVSRMAGLRGAAEQARYVAELKARFGRRRNFMKLLD